MPRPKGPEKRKLSVSLTVPVFEWLQNRAGHMARGEYIAAQLEREYQKEMAKKKEAKR